MRGGRAHGVARPAAAAQALLELCPGRVVEPSGPALVPHPPQGRPGADRPPAKLRYRPGAAGDQDRRDIGADRAHQRARDALVAVGQHDQPVERVGAHHFLDLDREQVAVEHRARLHQVLAERDGPELRADAAGLLDARLHLDGQLAQRQVARIQVAGRVRDADHRPVGGPADASGPRSPARPGARAQPRRRRRARPGCAGRTAGHRAGSGTPSPGRTGLGLATGPARCGPPTPSRSGRGGPSPWRWRRRPRSGAGRSGRAAGSCAGRT